MTDVEQVNNSLSIHDLDMDVLPGGVAAATAGPICVVLIFSLIINLV